MYLNKVVLIFVSFFMFGASRYLTESPSNHSNTVEDVNHAICKIVTKDIQASANATITRQLKGVCTSKELNKRIDQLEKRLLNEIYIIKRALHVENEIVPNEDNYKFTKTLENRVHDYDYVNSIETVDTKNVYHPQTVMYRSLDIPENTKINKTDVPEEHIIKIETATEKPITSLVNVNTTKKLHVAYKRDFEAAKYNVSIQSTEFEKMFLYFWKIYDINEVRSYTDTHLESPVFYVSGHPMHINFYPHHQGTNYAALELFSADNFILKHRFTVLNQNNEQGDLTSQILGMNAPRFRISNEKLFNENFTTDGSLTIKVAITLRT